MADFVAPKSPCWKYMGVPTSTGYGPHRRVYERFVAPIPEGCDLDHLCRNRWCVNPDHLEPVSHCENVQRSMKDFCFRGHPRNEINTTWSGGQRYCKPCRAATARNFRARRKAAL